jgi:glycosyltransferase involved in cell wall biosynthesis
MSQVPLVSIIIPCYNAEAMIERCLQSCFQQVYLNIEIIVVDNNSTDKTMAIASLLANATSHRLLLSNCPQQGANYARNYGFTQANGDYIQWLDADDELTPNKIAMQVSALEKNRNYDIAYGDWDWCFWRNGECRTTLKFKSQQYDDYLTQLLVDNWRPPHTYLLRHQAATQLHELQAWHPQRNMDREYFTLAALLGYRFLYVPDAGIRYNSWSSNQITKSTSKFCCKSAKLHKSLSFGSELKVEVQNPQKQNSFHLNIRRELCLTKISFAHGRTKIIG